MNSVKRFEPLLFHQYINDCFATQNALLTTFCSAEFFQNCLV